MIIIIITIIIITIIIITIIATTVIHGYSGMVKFFISLVNYLIIKLPDFWIHEIHEIPSV